MKIDSLKDLEKLVKLCRKAGIDAIKVDGVEFSLGQEPYKAQKAYKQVSIDPGQGFAQQGLEDARINTPDELTEDQLLFYSAGSDSQVSGAV